MTGFPKYRPQLATLVERPPSGDQWLHEVKFDGYRIACLIRDGKVRLESRRNVDWTAKFPEIVAAAKRLSTSFQGLQASFLRGASREGLTYFAFDLTAFRRRR